MPIEWASKRLVLKHCLTWFVQAGSPKSAGQTWRPRKELMSQLESQSSRLAEFLLPCFLLRPSTNQTRPPTLWTMICFTNARWCKCWSHPKKSLQKRVPWFTDLGTMAYPGVQLDTWGSRDPVRSSYPGSTCLFAEFPAPPTPHPPQASVEGHLQECSSLPVFPASCSATWNSPTAPHHAVASLSPSHSVPLWPGSSFQTSPGEHQTLVSIFIEVPKLPGMHIKLQKNLAHAPLLSGQHQGGFASFCRSAQEPGMQVSLLKGTLSSLSCFHGAGGGGTLCPSCARGENVSAHLLREIYSNISPNSIKLPLSCSIFLMQAWCWGPLISPGMCMRAT